MYDNEETVNIITLEKKDEYLLPLIQETLDKEDIALHLHSNYDTAYDGVFVGQKGVATLYVFKKDEERARAIVEDIIRNK